MKNKSPRRALIFDSILFLVFGVLVWTINLIGQSSFPGNNPFPFLVRSVVLLFSLILSFYLNDKFCRRNLLISDTLIFKPGRIRYYLGGIVVGCFLIATIWAIIYLIYPFEIIKNPHSKTNLATDMISYSLGNTLEEFLFRGFILVAFVKLFGNMGGILVVSLLFGLFHLQGTGLTVEGLTMVTTTFTMSLLFISVIYCTKSIWTAAALHIMGNLLLHSLGFDGTNNGLFHIEFVASNVNALLLTFIYEVVVIVFALVIFSRAKPTTFNCG